MKYKPTFMIWKPMVFICPSIASLPLTSCCSKETMIRSWTAVMSNRYWKWKNPAVAKVVETVKPPLASESEDPVLQIRCVISSRWLTSDCSQGKQDPFVWWSVTSDTYWKWKSRCETTAWSQWCHTVKRKHKSVDLTRNVKQILKMKNTLSEYVMKKKKKREREKGHVIRRKLWFILFIYSFMYFFFSSWCQAGRADWSWVQEVLHLLNSAGRCDFWHSYA